MIKTIKALASHTAAPAGISSNEHQLLDVPALHVSPPAAEVDFIIIECCRSSLL